MKITPIQIFYGLMSVIGVCVTWYFNLQPREVSFMADLYSTTAGASIGNDIMVVCVTFFVWAFMECRRLKMSLYLWAGICAASLLIAVAMTFPLFLLLRERRMTVMQPAAVQ